MQSGLAWLLPARYSTDACAQRVLCESACARHCSCGLIRATYMRATHRDLNMLVKIRSSPASASLQFEEFVAQTMDIVELDTIGGQLVGIPGQFGLSGEQFKRLTIAVELVANPSIIFCGALDFCCFTVRDIVIVCAYHPARVFARVHGAVQCRAPACLLVTGRLQCCIALLGYKALRRAKALGLAAMCVQ